MSGSARTSSRSELGRRAAAASEAHAAQAARDVLERGNAVDAVIAGVLAAAAVSSTVFLGSVQILVAGGGGGLLAVDGRPRQPGRGAPRPRGFLADEAVPAAARVAVPALPGALAAASRTLGSLPLLSAGGPALLLAKGRSEERTRLLDAFCRRGTQILTSEEIVAELLAVAGRAARGLVTAEDLAEVRPEIARFDERALGPHGVLLAPWRATATPGEGGAAFTHAVAAADARGMIAAACYESAPAVASFPALGVDASAVAAPVLRGLPRVAPGKPRPTPSPIALRARRGIPDLALAVAQSPDAEASLDAVLDDLELAPTITEALSPIRSGRPVALSRVDAVVRVFASA